MLTSRNRSIAWITAVALVALAPVPFGGRLAAEPGPGLNPQMDIEDPDDQAFDGAEPEEPDPSTKDGIEAPPPVSTPNRQDREDLLGGEEPPTVPEIRAVTLNTLYERLRQAKDAKAAEPISAAIEQAWRSSGSDTVDLLMARVDSFILAANLDLALEVLNAVTDLAPEDAEAWHQRGLVNFMKGDNQRALADLHRALDADPRHYKAMRDLGVVLRQTGDKKGALAAYRKALEINPFFEQVRPAEEELAHELEGQDI
jgi:tetratricopeptide (TPR) repeat protein